MSTRSQKSSSRQRPPLKDRRASPDAPASLRQIKGLFVRPVALERRDGKLRVVLVDRRQAAPVAQEPSTAELCAELGARLLAHDPGHGTQSVRFLMLVHDALGRKGWDGVAALPAPVLSKAAMLVRMMAKEDPSPLLDQMLEKMKPLRVAAELREENDTRLPAFELGRNVEVSESDFVEFDSLERSWEGTVPAGFVPTQRDD
jgi:hypothetical protein